MVSDTVIGSDIEVLVHRWLTKRGIPFNFQTQLMGGIFSLGGAVVDFIIEPNLAWRVHGRYWHTGVEKEGTDAVQRELLEGQGYVVVDIWGDSLESDKIDQTLELALEGREILR